ncbi:MAG: hypothetical protein RJS98_10265 [Rhodospirillaceae bacterium]
MFWKQQGSGPWGGGGSGGPWGGKGGKGGRGGNGGGDGGGSWGGGQPPPDLEELLKRSQDRVKQFIPGGMGSSRGI